MVQVVDRDLELLRWVNGFGFVMVDQVARWMGVIDKTGERRVRKLESLGLVERQRLFASGGSLVRVTRQGVELSGDNVGPLRKVRLGQFEHDRDLVDLALTLEAEFPGTKFLPERRIRNERGMVGVGQKGHVADGFLIDGEGKRTAIELELTRKQRWRLKKIVGEFQRDLKLKKVWYFCGEGVADLVTEMVGKDPLFEVFDFKSIRKELG